jgi:hypothetical protein
MDATRSFKWLCLLLLLLLLRLVLLLLLLSFFSCLFLSSFKLSVLVDCDLFNGLEFLLLLLLLLFSFESGKFFLMD